MPTHHAAVTEIEELAPRVVQLTVAFNDEAFQFEPGQWVNFHFPEGIARAYTIASPPQRPQAVELCVRVGEGKGGLALKKLQAGAEVRVDGPFGEFVLPDDDVRQLVFLAGDTGIAPVRSIILHMLATNDPRAITVLYEPDQRHILYAADFDPLARAGQIVHESGKIETLMQRNRKVLSDATLMAAGFDPFLDRVHKELREYEIERSAVITESFGPVP
jgi:ferredoxin-NADP reductase